MSSKYNSKIEGKKTNIVSPTSQNRGLGGKTVERCGLHYHLEEKWPCVPSFTSVPWCFFAKAMLSQR